MEFSDLIYLLFVGICFWLAVYLDDSSGGGKRQAIPVRLQ